MTELPPPALVKRGLREIHENTDGELPLPSGLLMTFFGKELEKRLMREVEPAPEPKPKRRRVLMSQQG